MARSPHRGSRLRDRVEASVCVRAGEAFLVSEGPSGGRGITRRLAQRSSTISDPRINERIRVPEVRLVGPNGEQVGIVRVEDALRLAAEADLDLVEVAPTAKPPVCKLMDFGKYKYEAAVKARESRKNQVNTVLKEVRFRLKIDKHDYETKTGHAKKFLSQGDKVKAIIQFRGREQQRPELGIKLLQQFAEDVAELGTVLREEKIDVLIASHLDIPAEKLRAITAVARLACPEALYGVTYTADEMLDASPSRPSRHTATRQAPAISAADFGMPDTTGDEPAVDTTTGEVIEEQA